MMTPNPANAKHNETVRDYQFDTIKGLMILLVVFCHVLSHWYNGWSKTLETRYIYCFIYTFHMPVLAFVSGYFSKRRGSYAEYVKKALGSCLIPFLLFNTLYGIPSLEKMINVFSPKWTLWFLLSLFFWKIMAEVGIVIKKAFPLSLIIALYAGSVSAIGGFFALSRTLCFFPFFFAGCLSQKERIDAWRKSRKIYAFLCIALTVAIAFIFVDPKINYKTLFMNFSYERLKQGILQGAFLRGLIFLAGFLCIFALIALLPCKKTIFSLFGKNSITIYLGHSLLIRILESMGARKLLRGNITNPWLFIVLDLAFSLAVCFLLGNEFLAGLYRRGLGKLNALLLTDVQGSIFRRPPETGS